MQIIDNGQNIIQIDGRIDSTNASEFEEKMMGLISGKTSVCLDLNNLEYISSAGLRVILKIKKTVKDVTAINVSSEVYEIFSLTGFADMLQLFRKRRTLSIDGCSEIARGAMGIIYRLDADTILKVYDKTAPLDSLYQGQEVLKKLFINDIPCAIPFDIVDVEDSHGAVYELLDAYTLAQYITKYPDKLDECAVKAAKLLKELHEGELPAGILPDSSVITGAWLDGIKSYLSSEDIAAFEKLLSGFRSTKNFLHLDFHTKNIMIKDGELMIIDLDDACTGDPMLDIGCLLMTLKEPSWNDELCNKFLGISRSQRDRYAKLFFETYFGVDDESKLTDIFTSLMPIAELRRMYARTHRVGLTDDQRKALISESLDLIHSALNAAGLK